MRTLKLLPLFAVVCSWAATAPAQQESEPTIADYTEAIRLHPKDAIARYNRGLAWLAKKEFDKAIVDFNGNSAQAEIRFGTLQTGQRLEGKERIR